MPPSVATNATDVARKDPVYEWLRAGVVEGGEGAAWVVREVSQPVSRESEEWKRARLSLAVDGGSWAWVRGEYDSDLTKRALESLYNATGGPGWRYEADPSMAAAQMGATWPLKPAEKEVLAAVINATAVEAAIGAQGLSPAEGDGVKQRLSSILIHLKDTQMGFPWDFPGVTYCLWWGVDCCRPFFGVGPDSWSNASSGISPDDGAARLRPLGLVYHVRPLPPSRFSLPPSLPSSPLLPPAGPSPRSFRPALADSADEDARSCGRRRAS